MLCEEVVDIRRQREASNHKCTEYVRSFCLAEYILLRVMAALEDGHDELSRKEQKKIIS